MRTICVKEAKCHVVNLPRVNYKQFCKKLALKRRVLDMAIRFSVRMGIPVFLVGHPGVGKSLMLNSALPGRVIDARELLVAQGWETPAMFSPEYVPAGPVGVDETGYFDKNSLLACADDFKKRGVAFATQRLEDATSIADELQISRAWVIYLGEPAHFKREYENLPYWYSAE